MSRFTYRNNINRRRSACNREFPATALPRKSGSRKERSSLADLRSIYPSSQDIALVGPEGICQSEAYAHENEGWYPIHTWVRLLPRFASTTSIKKRDQKSDVNA